MNVIRAGFRLMPVHFFSRNPAMDLPEVPSEAVKKGWTDADGSRTRPGIVSLP